MRYLQLLTLILMFVLSAGAASKPHVVSLGKAVPVKLLLERSEEPLVSITVRPLYLDTKLKENTTGPAHDITDRVFVIRRAYRVNDSLPTESSASHAGFGSAKDGSWPIAIAGAS